MRFASTPRWRLYSTGGNRTPRFCCCSPPRWFFPSMTSKNGLKPYKPPLRNRPGAWPKHRDQLLGFGEPKSPQISKFLHDMRNMPQNDTLDSVKFSPIPWSMNDQGFTTLARKIIFFRLLQITWGDAEPFLVPSEFANWVSQYHGWRPQVATIRPCQTHNPTAWYLSRKIFWVLMAYQCGLHLHSDASAPRDQINKPKGSDLRGHIDPAHSWSQSPWPLYLYYPVLICLSFPTVTTGSSYRHLKIQSSSKFLLTKILDYSCSKQKQVWPDWAQSDGQLPGPSWKVRELWPREPRAKYRGLASRNADWHLVAMIPQASLALGQNAGKV